MVNEVSHTQKDKHYKVLSRVSKLKIILSMHTHMNIQNSIIINLHTHILSLILK